MATPMYRRIEEDLLAKIQDGTYAPNETIPSEIQLAELYKVSRPTIRQAIQNLADAGYVEKRRKRGTVVCNRKFGHHFVDRLISHDPMFFDIEPSTMVLAFRREHATPKVAVKLEIAEGQEVYHLFRLRSIDAEPALLMRTYIPADMFPNLMNHDFTKERLYNAYSLEGHPIDSARRVLNVALPDEIGASLLDIDPTEPCFTTDSIGRNKSGVPIEYTIALYRGDNNSFTIDMSVSNES